MKLVTLIGGFNPEIRTPHKFREVIMLASELLNDSVNTTFSPPARWILDRKLLSPIGGWSSHDGNFTWGGDKVN
jgi:hypothetical protein